MERQECVLGRRESAWYVLSLERMAPRGQILSMVEDF
jgi:hypothetical protein